MEEEGKKNKEKQRRGRHGQVEGRDTLSDGSWRLGKIVSTRERVHWREREEKREVRRGGEISPLFSSSSFVENC